MGTGITEPTSFALLDHYVSAGGNFLDTANNYCAWAPGGTGDESELLLGRWMASRKNRNQLVVATKVGFERAGDVRGLRATQIVRWCENSLKNMGLETIDLFYAHCDDLTTPLEETLGAFAQLVKDGKVRSLGASNFTASRLAQAQQMGGWPGYCCVQQRYTYLRPHPQANFDPQLVADDSLLTYCAEQGLSLLAYSPLLGGAYDRSDKRASDKYLWGARRETLRSMAVQKGVSQGALVLAWMTQQRPRILPLLGVSQISQLVENLNASQIRLTADELQKLNEAKDTPS